MTLTAQYHSRCTECDEPIIPGQQIRAEDDQWVHHDCAATTPTRVECVCEKCFEVHAGECAW
jgi:hypothetical protein